MKPHGAIAVAICLVLFIFQGCVDYSPLDLDGGNECTPSCKDKCCGPDGCGGTCPDNCAQSEICDRATCRCEGAPKCETNEDCPRNYWCDRTVWECRLIDCIPNCTGKCCGEDGCGRQCPDNCPVGLCCEIASCICVTDCYWQCDTDLDCMPDECCIHYMCVDMACGPLECGPDPVCTKECGPCGAGRTCQGGQCVIVERRPGDPCTFGDVNITAGYCSAGLECLGIMADGTAGTCPGGESYECTNLLDEWNRDCVGGNCGASFCSEECGAGDTCPPGFVPQDVSGNCMCIPVPTGAGQPGDPCPLNNVNASYDDCEAGMECLGVEDIGLCPGGTDAECTGVAGNWNPDCVNDICGFSFCSEECNAGGNCPTGYMPADVSGTCYCIPGEGEGDLPGEPCPFGDMNTGYDFCASGLACLGNDNTGSCPGGSPTECGIPDVQNPDCVNGTCGFSFCSARCDAQGNCEAGYQPVDLAGNCYCIPDEVETSQAGDPCPFGNVNDTSDNCAPGLACLGFPADGQAGTCPGGNPTECIDIPANANPDCVNGNCGASFCAEQCDAQGHCPAGFVCQDIGDTWFCVPA